MEIEENLIFILQKKENKARESFWKNIKKIEIKKIKNFISNCYRVHLKPEINFFQKIKIFKFKGLKTWSHSPKKIIFLSFVRVGYYKVTVFFF